MKQWTVVSLVGLVLAGCTKSAPSTPAYVVTIGTKSINLPVHDDPKLIQNDLLAVTKPLWENLTRGESEVFQYKRVIQKNIDLDELEIDKKRKIEAKYGPNATLTSTSTSAGPQLRFFKDRNGEYGLECVDEKEPSVCFSGNITDWKSVAACLKATVFKVDQIQRMIQEVSDPADRLLHMQK